MDKHDFEKQVIDLLDGNGASIKKALDILPLGVLITNLEGRVIYYNNAHSQIDDLDPDLVIGNIENDVLCGPDIMGLCQKTRRPVRGVIFPYRTIRGKEVNAAHWVFPFFQNGQLTASICFTYDLSPPMEQIERQRPQVQWDSDRHFNASVNDVVGSSSAFRKTLRLASQAARSPLPVLLTGPTGSGKEMIASYIHQSSDRSQNKYLALNCAAIPANLIEGLLFGTTKGSFTGAGDRPGLLEEAHGGVLYLDEFDSMPLELQPKLLRVLQNMSVRRLGSEKERALDVKIISSIGVPPQQAIEEGRLRLDIFYRLAVVTINLPSLVERLEDMEELVNYFIGKYNTLLNRNILRIETGLFELFFKYRWPGNIRELEHLVAGAINTAEPDDLIIEHRHLTEHYQRTFDDLVSRRQPSETMEPRPPLPNKLADIPPAPSQITPQPEELWNVLGHIHQREFEAIITALTETRGQVGLAAKQLGISRQRLSYRLKKYNLNRQDFKNKAPR